MTLDVTDWDIINALSREDLSNTELARRLGVSESTVRQRLRRLKASGILKVRALYDPNRLEDRQLAYVTVTVAEARLLDAKAREIAELEHVLSVSIVSGQFDLVLEVLVDSNKGLIRFLTEELTRVDGLTKTETLLQLRSYNKWV